MLVISRFKFSIRHCAQCQLDAKVGRRLLLSVAGLERAEPVPPPALWATDRRRHGSLLLTKDNGYSLLYHGYAIARLQRRIIISIFKHVLRRRHGHNVK